MVSPAVMGTGTVSNVSAKSVSRNSCSGSGSDFKKVMAASLAQNTAGAGKNPADNKLSVPIAEKSDAQTAKSVLRTLTQQMQVVIIRHSL